jgi:hypothetical protein
MKTNKIITAVLACSLVGAVHAAPNAQWATQFSNQKTSLITGKINSPVANNNHEAVSFSYKLAGDEQLDFDVKPFKAQSRQYWLDSSSDKLATGINLPVSGGQTIIRISPLTNDKSLQLSAAGIHIQNNGVSKNIQVFADSADLKATGAAFSDQSIALKIEATAGLLNLQVDSKSSNTPFVIHVLEKDSPFVLALNANKASYNANQTISINAGILAHDKNINTNLQGYINRPDGSVLGQLNFEQNKNGNYVADLDAIGAQGMAQGLWEVHVFAKSMQNGIEIMRDAQTSFAVNLNTAEFSGNLKMVNNNVQIGVNVGVEGRYEVRGVLMGTNKAGQLQPIAMTMAADWLKVGVSSISLPMDAKIIATSGLAAPFSIQNIKLTNQTYLAPVQNIKAGIKLIDFNFDEKFDMR